MKKIVYNLLSVLELPFMILGWIDYYLNLICKFLTKGCLLFIIPSFLLMPITLIYGYGGTSIIYIKNNIIGNKTSFNIAMDIWLSQFPDL